MTDKTIIESTPRGYSPFIKWFNLYKPYADTPHLEVNWFAKRGEVIRRNGNVTHYLP